MVNICLYTVYPEISGLTLSETDFNLNVNLKNCRNCFHF